jgi:outer membrane murein-binding lipoprotein Lpp
MINDSTQVELAIANPEYAAAITISDLVGDRKHIHTTVLAQTISDRSKTPLAVAKRTLSAQIATLDALFNRLVTQAAEQNNYQARADLFDLALTAQARCRETIITLNQLHQMPTPETNSTAPATTGHPTWGVVESPVSHAEKVHAEKGIETPV